MADRSPKQDTSWQVFILPLAIIGFVVLAVWYLSSGAKIDAGYKAKGEVKPQFINGLVIKNVMPSDVLGGLGYIEVLTAENQVETIYFLNSEKGCFSSVATTQGVSATVGQKIVAHGLPVGNHETESCSSQYFYIKNLGISSPYEKWTLYTDTVSGFEFKYPREWNISTSSSASGKVVTLSKKDDANSALEITAFSGALSFEPAEWAKQYYGDSAGEPQSTTISNAKGVVVPIQTGSTYKKALLIKRGDSMIQFIFSSDDVKDKDLVAIPALIIKSIQLINVKAAGAAEHVSETEVVDKNDTGVTGQVLITNSCPAGSENIKDLCSPQSFKTKLRVLDGEGQLVTRFSTYENGGFRLSLLPGIYMIESDSTSATPWLTPTRIIVKSGLITNVTLTFNNGIW